MAGKRKMPVKIATLDFTEDGYPDFECSRRLNLPLGTIRQIREAETEDESRAGFLKVFTDWNFVDENGDPIPHSVEGFNLIPDDLWAAMLERGNKAVREAAMPANLDGTSSKDESEVPVTSEN